MRALAVLVLCLASLALADDFKTTDGKEYKNAKVSRVEPDGLLLITKSGISKVYFSELPKEVQERFHYDSQKAAEFTSQTVEQNKLWLQQRAGEEQKRAEERKKYWSETEKEGQSKTEHVELEYDPPEQLIAAAHKAAQEKMFSPEEEKEALAKIPAGGTVVVKLFSIASGSADPRVLTYVIMDSSGKVLARMTGNSAMPFNEGDYQWTGVDQIDLPAFEDSLRVRIYHEIAARTLGDYIITPTGQPQRIQ